MGVPSILYHNVDEDSPLHGLTQENLEERDMEILVILDGIDETTATPVQVGERPGDQQMVISVAHGLLLAASPSIIPVRRGVRTFLPTSGGVTTFALS